MTHKLMHELVGKHAKNAKKQKRPNGWHKASKATITSHGVEKGYASSKPTSQGCVLTSSHIQTSHKRDRCNHTSKCPQKPTSTSLQRAKSVAKPRSRQANRDTKHRSKQAYTCIKEIIQTL